MKHHKILTMPLLLKKISQLRKKGLKIVFTNGCFDLLHVGHISVLERAKKLGDVLVVGVNSDRSVAKLKGPHRPLTSLKDRLRVPSALEAVDFVTSFTELTPLNIIRRISPDTLVKGGDYRAHSIVGAQDVIKSGGRVCLVPLVKNHSTSQIIGKLSKL